MPALVVVSHFSVEISAIFNNGGLFGEGPVNEGAEILAATISLKDFWDDCSLDLAKSEGEHSELEEVDHFDND